MFYFVLKFEFKFEYKFIQNLSRFLPFIKKLLNDRFDITLSDTRRYPNCDLRHNSISRFESDFVYWIQRKTLENYDQKHILKYNGQEYPMDSKSIKRVLGENSIPKDHYLADNLFNFWGLSINYQPLLNAFQEIQTTCRQRKYSMSKPMTIDTDLDLDFKQQQQQQQQMHSESFQQLLNEQKFQQQQLFQKLDILKSKLQQGSILPIPIQNEIKHAIRKVEKEISGQNQLIQDTITQLKMKFNQNMTQNLNLDPPNDTSNNSNLHDLNDEYL